MKLAAPIIAGAAVLALANVALADEASLSTADQPILLTDAQMDSVTAGTRGRVLRSLRGDAIVDGSSASATTSPACFAFARIAAFEPSASSGTCLTGHLGVRRASNGLLRPRRERSGWPTPPEHLLWRRRSLTGAAGGMTSASRSKAPVRRLSWSAP